MGNVLEFIFLLCCLYATGDSNVTGSLQPVVGLVGDDVILPCHLEPSLNVRGLTIEWSNSNLIDKLVHVRWNGRDVSDSNPSYKNRTAFFKGELKNGNVSLKLSRVQISDEGRYRCFLPYLSSLVKEAVIELKIGAVSKPQVSIVGSMNGGVVLQCESGGWYPEPEVEWLDSEGHVLSADNNSTSSPLIIYRYNRFYVQINVTVAEKGRFTCRVVQQHINQTREEDIDIRDADFQSSSSALDNGIRVSDAIILLIIAGVVVFLAFLFYSWKKSGPRKYQLRM